jgi:hypothetical protein
MVSSTCSEFIGGQGENRKQIFLAVFIPVGVVLLLGTLGLLFYFYKKRKSQEFSIGNDESWLLSFRDLIKPPMQHYDSGNSYQRKYSKDVFFHTKGDGAELASKRNSQVDDWVSTEGTIIYPAGKSRTSTDVGLPKLDAVSETMLNSEQNSGTKTPEEEKTKLLHAVGN